jgi:ABC-type Fe3+ transport system permease subunit
MTFTAACGWSLLRSALVAAIGLWIAVHLQRLLAITNGPARRLYWVLLLAPFLSPGLIVGYGYRNYSLSLVQYPWWNEALYSAIVLFQAVPIGVLLLHFAPPPPVSSSGVHCLRLLAGRRAGGVSPRVGAPTVTGSDPPPVDTRGSPILLRDRLKIVLRGPMQVWLPAASVMFLIAFQEAEVAALMQARGWTEWLFTRQAGLVDVAALLQHVAVLIGIQSIVCVPVLHWLQRSARESRATPDRPRYRAGRGWCSLLIAGCVLNVFIPAWLVLSEAVHGVPVLRQQPSFWREVLYGLLFAATAGVLAVVIARWLRSEGSGSRGQRSGQRIGESGVTPHPRPLSRDGAVARVETTGS